VPRHLLTAAELADVQERATSAAARKCFGILLRKARQAELRPLKAAISILRAKVAAGEPEVLTDDELALLVRDAPEHVKDHMYQMNRRERPTSPGGAKEISTLTEAGCPRRFRSQDRPPPDTK